MTKNKKIGIIKTVAVFCAFALITAAAGGGVYYTLLKYSYPKKYTEYIEKYAEEYSVPENLLYATAKVESGFDKNACSEAGALGLTQIMPDTLVWLQTKTGDDYSADDLMQPEVSVKYCAVFYSILLSRFQDTETAIAAYHAGINQVSKWLENPEYSSDGKTLDKIPSKATGHYVDKVTDAVNIYGNLYKEEQ